MFQRFRFNPELFCSKTKRRPEHSAPASADLVSRYKPATFIAGKNGAEGAAAPCNGRSVQWLPDSRWLGHGFAPHRFKVQLVRVAIHIDAHVRSMQHFA